MFESLLILMDDIDAGRNPDGVGEDLLVTVEPRTWLGDSFRIFASIKVIHSL
ncbi:hypothetical protein INS49_006281 [Diaporthe citri]|uniref:uncharacterized protein n=1 Tax=Diaporthe citri TaxID=83186 RepID=UPI001C7F8B2E|nr:uncharacterized protein INS49_006281 [Diaporthe citri]KAG6364677.1 hypothetical protein INS49_006281 [Diaporthe citri]